MTLISSAISTVRNWWWFAIKGLLLLAAGVAILIRPAEGYVGLSVLFSVIIFCVGLVQIAFALGNRATLSGWGWLLMLGIFTLIFAWLVLYFPLAGAVSIIYYSALAFIAGGLGALVLAFTLRGAGKHVEHLKKDLKGGLA